MLRFILWHSPCNANATKQSAKNADAVSQGKGRVGGKQRVGVVRGSADKSKAKTANETQRNVSILIVAAADLKGPKD